MRGLGNPRTRRFAGGPRRRSRRSRSRRSGLRTACTQTHPSPLPRLARNTLDRLSLLAPSWQERHPADVGVALVEALAYVGDHLSYRQDAIATEAYLGTARLRTSVRRHARLVDYQIDEGSNARAWLRVEVKSDIPLGIPHGTRCSTLFGTQTPPVMERSVVAYQQAVTSGAVFWETVHDSVPLFAEHREMFLYNWSDREACLPPGATHATLEGSFPNLKRGMVLLLAEIKGPAHRRPRGRGPRPAPGGAIGQ